MPSMILCTTRALKTRGSSLSVIFRQMLAAWLGDLLDTPMPLAESQSSGLLVLMKANGS